MKPGKDYIGVGVGVVIMDKKGRILLIKRSKTVRNEPGTWVIPGGEVEYGETIYKAVMREAKEEVGVKVKPIKQLGTADHLMKKDKHHWVSTIVFCKIVSGKPKNMELKKCEKVEWFDLKDVKKLKIGVMMKKNLEILKSNFPEKFYE